MADEQAQVEKTTKDAPASEGNKNEQATSQESVSEDDNTPTSERSSGGDLSVALRQEREKRQALEARLSDPQFVYQQAKYLGLTDEEAQEEVEAQTSTQQVNQPPYDVSRQVQFELDKERTLAKFPDLEKDDEAQIAISAISQAKGIPLSKAAENYFTKIGKASSEAKEQGAAAKEAEITAKERAATTPQTGGNISSDKSEEERLVADSRSLDRNKQMKALEELELRKMRAS